MTECKYYFDESVEVAVSVQLDIHGFDVVSAHSLGTLGDSDVNHLTRATEMGRILCTYDDDFLKLAATGVEHAGIIFAQHRKITIGVWIKGIQQLHNRLNAEDTVNAIYFLPAQ